MRDKEAARRLALELRQAQADRQSLSSTRAKSRRYRAIERGSPWGRRWRLWDFWGAEGDACGEIARRYNCGESTVSNIAQKTRRLQRRRTGQLVLMRNIKKKCEEVNSPKWVRRRAHAFCSCRNKFSLFFIITQNVVCCPKCWLGWIVFCARCVASFFSFFFPRTLVRRSTFTYSARSCTCFIVFTTFKVITAVCDAVVCRHGFHVYGIFINVSLTCVGHNYQCAMLYTQRQQWG